MPSLPSDAQLTQIREQLRQGADVIQRNGYRLLAETLRQADALVEQLRQERDAIDCDLDADGAAAPRLKSGTAARVSQYFKSAAATRDALKARAEAAEAAYSCLRRALEAIYDRATPPSNEKGEPFELNYGSNGQRDFIEAIAAKALGLEVRGWLPSIAVDELLRLEAALSVRDDGPQTAEKTEETDKAL